MEERRKEKKEIKMRKGEQRAGKGSKGERDGGKEGRGMGRKGTKVVTVIWEGKKQLGEQQKFWGSVKFQVFAH